MTIIKLIDGTRAYLHAVIDNYSRRILSWTLEARLGSGGTCQILREAAIQLRNRSRETTVSVGRIAAVFGGGGSSFPGDRRNLSVERAIEARGR